MDDLVRQAMAKWPNVPDCYGWLGLDSRGQWFMRDDRAQSLGSFQCGQKGARGSVLRHDKLIAFIGRNYESDDTGRWYFQNGPQRVYVELDCAPLIWRLNTDGSVTAHTGEQGHVLQCMTDEEGRLFMQTSAGFGLLHSLDVAEAAEWIERGQWPLEESSFESLVARFAYVLSPQKQVTGSMP